MKNRARMRLVPCLVTLALVAASTLGQEPGATPPRPAWTDSRLLAPLPIEKPLPPKTRFKSNHPIDRFLAEKWEQAKLRPAPRSDDYTFCRRIYLDLAGVVPPLKALQDFVRNTSHRKRDRLIDKLLADDRYAAHWGIFWEDLLRAQRRQRGAEPDSFRQYIQAVLKDNQPYDQWVRDMITATGPTADDPAVNFVLRHQADPNELTISVTQVFMGMQLKCVQCHDDRTGRFWNKSDFVGLAGFWSRTKVRPDHTETITVNGRTRELRLAKVVDRPGATGTYLGKPNPSAGQGRDALANTLTDRSNPYFARAVVNRVWKQLMGTGLVEPVDDLDPDNPASHPQLLDWLAIDFVENGYDLKHLIRTVVTSHAYQLSSVRFRRRFQEPTERLFDSMPLRRMSAEQLYDSILLTCGALQNPKVKLAPAIQMRYPPRPASFLATFEAHDRQTHHPRHTEATIPQALALLNGNFVNRAVAWHETNPLRVWAKQGLAINEAIDRLYLLTLSRKPTKQERSTVRKYVRSGKPAQRWSDVLWALINTREFMFIR